MALYAKKQFVSLKLIVPLIFSCLSILSMIVAYQIIMYCLRTGADTYVLLTGWGVVMTGFTFAAALVIARMILRPIDEFVKSAEAIPEVKAEIAQAGRRAKDELGHYAAVLDRVTDILSKHEARERFPDIVGQSPAIRGVMSKIAKVAPTDAGVLITGESGAGKEIVAQAVHAHSKRRDKPFVAVNCAAIPEGLLESELFGHEKGAFTGATAQRKGRFELADKGTLFLDEIGDMPIETQAKILRALETGVCERVGGTKPISFDVRVIAATNKNFEEMIAAGKFREDLYHRLNVFPIDIPPLRERVEDLPLLAEHFLKRFGPSKRLSPEALDLLVKSRWPGNIRELRNMVERAAVLADADLIEPRCLTGLKTRLESCDPGPPALEGDLDERLAEMEKAMILAALAKHGGVQVRAALELGVKERSLHHRIKKYQIDVAQLK